MDLLFINGNILTLDHQNTRAGSLAVANGKICGIWQEGTPPKHAIDIREQTSIVDLKGKTLHPGFIDTHNHILMYSQMRNQVNCSTPPNKTIQDILEAIGKRAKEIPDGEWVQGYGYDDTLLYEKRHPTCFDLDKVSPNNPVIIKHISGHLAAVNTQALHLADLHEDISDPPGSHFGRNGVGRLNGVLYEWGAMDPVTRLLPKRTIEEMTRDIKEAAKEYVAHGITTNTDAGIGIVAGFEELEVHLKAAEKNMNPMRTQLMIMHYFMQKGNIYGDYTPKQIDAEIRERSNGLARFDSAKMFQDGSLQGLTGALRTPYYNALDVYGDLIHDQTDFQEEVLDLHKRGFRITTHGNGDRAIKSILDAYEYALTKSPRSMHRHRIEHVQTAIQEDIQRMAKLNVAGSFFINHIYYWGDRHERIFLGPQRARRMNPLAEAVENNLLFTLHSDCPITPISPLFSVWAAVNRKTREGKILGGEQRIDVETALKSMTIYGAKLNFNEDLSGSLEIGKQADLIVLEADPTKVNPDEIKDIRVVTTFIDGQPIYGHKQMVTM